MQSIEFQVAQKQLGEYLHKKLHGEIQNGFLEARAQRLANMWWTRSPPVVMGTSGIRVVGCELAFDVGAVKVARWKTQFVEDRHRVMVTAPDAVPLGYANGFQLYLVHIDATWSLVARSQLITNQWRASEGFTPPSSSPLFIALERAKALGYLSYLKEA